jgi:hypothetical protein
MSLNNFSVIPKEIVSPERIESTLVNVLAKSIAGTRKVQLVCLDGSVRQNFSNNEIIGEFCTQIRREMREYEPILRNFRIAKTCMWEGIGRPHHSFAWNFSYETTEGMKQMTALHAEQFCVVAARKAANSMTMEDEFREINVKMSNLFTEMIVLQTLNKRAYSINDEANVVLENLCKVAEKLAS